MALLPRRAGLTLLLVLLAPTASLPQAVRGSVDADVPPPMLTYHGLVPGLHTAATVRAALGDLEAGSLVLRHAGTTVALVGADDFRDDAYEETMSQGPAAAPVVRDTALRMLAGLR